MKLHPRTSRNYCTLYRYVITTTASQNYDGAGRDSHIDCTRLAIVTWPAAAAAAGPCRYDAVAGTGPSRSCNR